MSIKRFGVSLESDVLETLDDFVEKNKFPNRSRAIRHMVINSHVKEKWGGNQEVAGAIVLVYDHHKRDLLRKSMQIQHDFHDLILSVQHVHLDHHHCLETIALKGQPARLRELASSLIGIKGIFHGDLVMTGL